MQKELNISNDKKACLNEIDTSKVKFLTTTLVLLWSILITLLVVISVLAFNFILLGSTKQGLPNTNEIETLKSSLALQLSQNGVILSIALLAFFSWMAIVGIHSFLVGILVNHQTLKISKKYVILGSIFPIMALTNTLVIRKKLKALLGEGKVSKGLKVLTISFICVWSLQLIIGFFVWLFPYAGEAGINIGINLSIFNLAQLVGSDINVITYFTTFLTLLFAFLSWAVLHVLACFILVHLTIYKQQEWTKIKATYILALTLIDLMGLILAFGIIVVNNTNSSSFDAKSNSLALIFKFIYFDSSIAAFLTVLSFASSVALLVNLIKKDKGLTLKN
ncbi:adhesin [Mycoplasmoides genitalium]